jgi:ADP-ribose pyrophosphatase YjhB (NUDIX family)
MTDATASSNRHHMPFTRVELAVLGIIEGELRVLLACRAEAPFADRWALPGGVLRIDLDQSLEDAAQRVARERLGVSVPFVRQLGAVGGPLRDPERSPWALSIVYRALVVADTLDLAAGKRVRSLTWRSADAAAQDSRLAFDHAAIIGRAVAATRDEIRDLALPAGVVPEHFTLGELQALCEHLLGERLDKSSFRRRLADRNLVEAVPGLMRTGPNRPAQVYRLRTDENAGRLR